MTKLEEIMKAIEAVLVIMNRKSLPICKAKIARIIEEVGK